MCSDTCMFAIKKLNVCFAQGHIFKQTRKSPFNLEQTKFNLSKYVPQIQAFQY